MKAAICALVLAACGHEPAITPDAPPPPDYGATKRISDPGRSPTSHTLPSQCVRPPGVTWLADAGSQEPQTAPLPAGTFHVGVQGCVWFDARRVGDQIEVEVEVHGCGFSADVPSTYVCTGSMCHAVVSGGSGSIGFEGCDPTGRGVGYAGGMGFTIDASTDTLATTGFVADSGSSPQTCECP